MVSVIGMAMASDWNRHGPRFSYVMFIPKIWERHTHKQTDHTDPEQRIGFFECVRGSEDILTILECVPNQRKRI